MNRKYVIHFHKTDTDHYDLMLEDNNTLLTWQIDIDDILNILDGSPAMIKRINDHRSEYLTYEGPISCDRGMVQIYDTGDFTMVESTKDIIVMSMSGQKFLGLLTIENPNQSESIISFKPKTDNELISEGE